MSKREAPPASFTRALDEFREREDGLNWLCETITRIEGYGAYKDNAEIITEIYEFGERVRDRKADIDARAAEEKDADRADREDDDEHERFPGAGGAA